MITARGVVLVVTAILTFLLARLTQVGWLYLLDAMLWGIILLSLALPWLAVTSVVVRRRLLHHKSSPGPPGPSEGDTVQVETHLTNGRAWPRYFLSVDYECPLAGPDESRQRFFVHRLDGRGSLSLTSSIQCQRRGLHQFGPVRVESKAPFGLFRRRARLLSPLSVLVYPQVHPLGRLPLLDGIQGTGNHPRRTRAGQEVAGSRQYFHGDPLRHIHWRNTGRLGRPVVKEFEDTQEKVLVITFDASREYGQGPDTTLEYSIKLAASVASYVVGRGGSVRLLTGGLPSQEMPWMSMLRELALLEAGQGPGLPGLGARLPAGCRVLAIVSDMDSQGIEALKRRAGEVEGMAAVVLEGFGDSPSQHADLALETLRRAGIATVCCRRGELKDALRSLESLIWSPRLEAQPLATSRP